jgi:MFS transporter, DHA1 family, multidrug resistance protein
VRSKVGDLYEGPALSRAIATLTMSMVVGSAMAPYFGGVITQSLGWRAGFWFLLVGSLAIMATVQLAMPETRARHMLDQSFARIWRESRAVVAQPVYLAYVIQAGFIYAQFLVFISVAPHVLTNVLHIPPAQFSLYYLFLSGGYFLGNFYVSRGSHALTGTQLINVGLALQFTFACVALALAFAGLVAPIYIFGAQFMLTVGQGLALPNVTARGVALAPGYAGVASSVMGFAQMAVAATCVQLMGFTSMSSWIPVLTFCVVVSLIAWITAMMLERRTPPTLRST